MRVFLFGTFLVLAAACGESDNREPPDTVLESQPAALTNVKTATFAFRAVGNSNRFECRIDGGEPQQCVPPVAIDLADGPHTFAVAAAFNADVDETPAEAAWTIDTVAPMVTLRSGPPDLDNDTTPTFEFDGSETGIAFECALDGGAGVACTSPFTLDVVDGNHTFAVVASDVAGNRSTPATRTWTVNTATPDTVIDSGPTAGSTTAATGVAFAFSSPDATATFECASEGVAFAACTSPVALGALADGGHLFAVRAVGVAGPDPSPAERAWTVDAIAPTVTITSTPANPSNVPAPQLSFTASEAGATFACAIDSPGFAACTSPFTSPALADGSHTFHVRATDAVGNAGGEATFSWVVDTIAPTVAITSQPAALSNDNTPTIAFTRAGAPITTVCSVDGGVAAACTSPFTAATVADGSHAITIIVTDAAGNSSSATSATFAVDTVVPSVAITTEPSALSNDPTPTVAFAVTDSPSSVTCQLDAQAAVACTSPFTFGATTDGNHRITVRVADGAGNASSAQTAQFTVDTAAPTVAITASPAALSNDATPTVTFTTAGGPTAITCQLDTGTPVACASPFTLGATADGAHTLTVRVADGAGNASSATTPSFTIDTVPPTVVINTEPVALSNDATPTITFTTGGAPTSTQCRVDAGTFATCTSPFTPTVTDGSHTITVRVTDGATNTASATTASFTVDTAAPTVTITAQPAALSNDGTPSVAFTTAGAPTATDCRVDAGGFAACASPFTASVGDGAHTITVRVIDGAGNTGSATTASFTVDTVAPTVAITTQPSPLSNDATPTVVFTTAGAPASVQCQVDSGTFAACASPFTAAVADGVHTITILVTDAATNSSTATTNPFTVDTVAPTVVIDTQPAALSNDATPTVAFTTGGAPTAVDCRVDAGAFASCTSPFTATVADGSHTITVRVTDGAGNTGSDTTTSFTVDTVAPTVAITVQPVSPSNDNTPAVTFTTGGAPTSTQCRVDAGAFAACTSPFTAAAVADGSHTITVQVTDGANNSASATTNAFVVDTVIPTVTLTSQPAALSNDPTATVAFTTTDSPTVIQCRVDAGTFGACTSPFTTNPLADGTHTITVRVADAATNASTATTSPFVVDTTPPVVAFDDAPPAQWPVNYFDVLFSSPETGVSFACSLNGAAFAPCTSPASLTTIPYNVLSTFTVRASDGANNVRTIATTWTSVSGLVLHYPWEQGSGRNTSLLAQDAVYSPNGPAAVPVVGGWAGTANGTVVSTAQIYAGTRQALSSSPNDNYTATFWIRLKDDTANGTVISTAAATGGLEVRMAGNAMTVAVVQSTGQTLSNTVAIPIGRWVHIGLTTTGIAKPLQIFVDGTQRAVVDTQATGFGPLQRKELVVGPFQSLDLDDLRFFNISSPSNQAMCALSRGTFLAGQNSCTPLSPGYELDFEGGRLANTGIWGLPILAPPQAFSFVRRTTGNALRLDAGTDWFLAGFNANALAANGHSLSLWWDASSPAGQVLDLRGLCGNFSCGIGVTYSGSSLDVFVGNDQGLSTTVNVPVIASIVNSLVVTEQRSAGQTVSITVYGNGSLVKVVPIGGDVFKNPGDNVRLPTVTGSVFDEFEFWTEDLSKDPEVLCENGFDGLFDPAVGACVLTANP